VFKFIRAVRMNAPITIRKAEPIDLDFVRFALNEKMAQYSLADADGKARLGLEIKALRRYLEER